MADMFASAAAFLNTSLRNHASRNVVINDRELNPSVAITLPASSGKSEWEEGEADGNVHAYDTRDWIVSAADMLDAFDQVVDVKRGWIITDSLDSQRYEVYAPPGVRTWRYCDNQNLRVRIHSRNIDS